MMNNFKLDKKVLRFIDDNRIYFMFFIVLIFMMLFAPKFNCLRNYTIILRTASVDSLVAVGFTMVMICKHLDLSVGQLISVGAIVTVGFRVEQFSHLDPALAWSLGLGFALLFGALIGLVNGLLVAKAKINSFIVTLGMMTILQGAINLYSDNAISANTEADFLILIVSAVIIGTTTMAGGRGGIFKSAIAVLMLTIVASGLNRFGFGNDVKMFTQGLILAVVILYEAYNLYKQEKFKGQRPELLKELESTE